MELLYKRFVKSGKAVIARGRADLEFSLREYSDLSAGAAHPFRPFLISSSYSKLKWSFQNADREHKKWKSLKCR